MLNHNQQLKWVWRNRAKRESCTIAGRLLRELTDRLETEYFTVATKAASMLAACVDDEFRRHCRIVGARDGTLRINVDQPGLVWRLQRRWLARVSEALQGQRLSTPLRRVTFDFGRTGVCVGLPEDYKR